MQAGIIPSTIPRLAVHQRRHRTERGLPPAGIIGGYTSLISRGPTPVPFFFTDYSEYSAEKAAARAQEHGCSSQCPFLSTRSVHLCANQGSWAAPSVSLAFEWVDGRIQHDPFHWLNGPLHVVTTVTAANVVSVWYGLFLSLVIAMVWRGDNN